MRCSATTGRSPPPPCTGPRTTRCAPRCTRAGPSSSCWTRTRCPSADSRACPSATATAPGCSYRCRPAGGPNCATPLSPSSFECEYTARTSRCDSPIDTSVHRSIHRRTSTRSVIIHYAYSYIIRNTYPHGRFRAWCSALISPHESRSLPPSTTLRTFKA